MLPLDVQRGAHPQGRLAAWLGTLVITYINNTFISRQKHVGKISVHQKNNLKKKNLVFQGLFQCWWQVSRYTPVICDDINTSNVRLKSNILLPSLVKSFRAVSPPTTTSIADKYGWVWVHPVESVTTSSSDTVTKSYVNKDKIFTRLFRYSSHERAGRRLETGQEELVSTGQFMCISSGSLKKESNVYQRPNDRFHSFRNLPFIINVNCMLS